MILTAEKIMTPMNKRYGVPVSESGTAMSGLSEHLRKRGSSLRKVYLKFSIDRAPRGELLLVMYVEEWKAEFRLAFWSLTSTDSNEVEALATV